MVFLRLGFKLNQEQFLNPRVYEGSSSDPVHHFTLG